MLEIIKKYQHKIDSVAIQYQIQPDYEIIYMEDEIPHYVVMVGLGIPLYSTRIYHESEAVAQLDKLYDTITLFLYSIKLDLLEKLVNKTRATVYYSYSHVDLAENLAYAIVLTLEDALDYFPEQSEILHYFGVGNLEDNELKALIKDKLKNNYLNTYGNN